MGYSTRHYARSYVGGGGTPEGLKLLLIANVAVYLLQMFGLNDILMSLFAAQVPGGFGTFYPWQIVTYMFLHGGFLHIGFNMLMLWMFGRELEWTWGRRKFLQYYFFCGIGAGICIIVLGLLSGDPRPTIGASGAIYGVFLASAMLWPDREVLIYFLFPIKMKYLVALLGAFALFGSFNSGGTISNIGHLGGLLAGYVYFKMGGLGRINFSPMASAQDAYKSWKLRRAKKKFQVYMKKHGHRSDRDPWVN